MDGDKTLAVLPVIAMVAVGLGLLALTPFSAFVILLLAVRPTLDLLKLSSNATGTAVGNTASQRGLDPSSIVGVLFLLAAALWLAGRIRSGQLVPGSRLRTAMLAFLAACALSVVGSVQPQASALEVLRIGTVVMMFVVLEQIITSRTVMIRVLVTCYVAMLIPLGFTLVGIVTGSPSSEVRGSFTRLTGPFNQSNTFARYLAFLLVFGIAIYPYVKPKLKLLFVAMLGLASVFMLLTLTRTAILGSVAGLVVLPWSRSARASSGVSSRSHCAPSWSCRVWPPVSGLSTPRALLRGPRRETPWCGACTTGPRSFPWRTPIP